jgi:hypothetical protein
MRLSFDVDGVLDTPKGLEVAKRAITRGDDVYIITARNERFSREVYELAKELGIPRLRVYFTNGADKWETVKRLRIERHYDNNREQLDKIRENTNAETELIE